MPTGVTAVEQSQANGRAEQRVRALRERLQIMVEDTRRRVLVRSKINDDKQPRFLVGWALGRKDADIITFMGDGSVRYNGSWKHSRKERSNVNDHEHQNALAKMK